MVEAVNDTSLPSCRCPHCGRDTTAPARPLGGMTKQQRVALTFIAGYVEEHRLSPSYDEIKIAVGIASKSGVFRLVDALTAKGFLVKAAGGIRARNLMVTDLGARAAA